MDEDDLAKCVVAHWQPFSRLEHAWIVVNEMRSIGYYLDIETFADVYQVTPRTEGGMSLVYSSVSLPSIEEAICLASLHAIGVFY